MHPPIPELADYGISPDHGFLPGEPNIARLPNYYSEWEGIIDNLQPLILSGRLWDAVAKLPTLSTEHLHTPPEWRRAYVVLVFMLHAYIWAGDKPRERIPPPLTIPLLEVSEHLELPPVATYAAVCLWNYKPIFPDERCDQLENLATINTLTGSMDEQWFYLISVAIEARGAHTLPVMLRAIRAARERDTKEVTKCLTQFAQAVDDIDSLLQRMYRHCDPHIFYHRIRPFLAGSKNMGEAGLPNGVLLDKGVGNAEYAQYRGGSNAQSSLIQFFDIVLGVEHRPTGEPRSPKSADEPGETGRQRWHGFIMEMRDYMPGPHKRFLEHVARVANIQEYVESHPDDLDLCTAFNAALAMVKALRTTHITMVSRYIVVKSREKSNTQRSFAANTAALNLATSSSHDTDKNSASGSKKLRGTGGTALIPFLKQARDETGEAAIGAWAKTLLDQGGEKSSKLEVKKKQRVELPSINENVEGQIEIVGLAGNWSMDNVEGGLCHW